MELLKICVFTANLNFRIWSICVSTINEEFNTFGATMENE